MTSPLAHLPALERRLVAAGFPAMTDWWRATLARFYDSGRRQLVLRVGRRGGKSTTLARVGVLEALYGQHQIPPGDVGVVAIVSVSRTEASERLRLVRAILDALGVSYRPIDGGVELVGRPIIFRVFAASIAGVSGFTCICAIADEVAKWRDADTGANPAREVLASLRPTLAGQPNARIFLSSSPLGFADAHATAFDDGDTAFQLVAFAETWTARPTLTEAETHSLEPDDRVWRREYAALPQAGQLAAFDIDAIDRAFAKPIGETTSSAPVLIVDPSSGGSDAFTACLCRWLWPPSVPRWKTYTTYVGGQHVVSWVNDPQGNRIPNPEWTPTVGAPFLRFDHITIIDGGFWGSISGSQIVSNIVNKLCRPNGVLLAYGDQRERLMLSSQFAQYGIRYLPIDWTATSKPLAVERVRGWLRDGAVSLEANDRLRSELLSFDERILPSGQLSFAARRGGHDDCVALLISAAHAEAEGGIPASPAVRRRSVSEMLYVPGIGRLIP